VSLRRYARFVGTDGRPVLARVVGVDDAGSPGPQAALIPQDGHLFGVLRDSGEPVPLASATLLSPVEPSKVIGIGSNYKAHAVEMGRDLPPVPKMFVMPSTAVTGPGAAIEKPPGSERVDHEAELAVVIGRRTTCVPEADALSHVFGYTACNDVTARDFQRADKVFGRAKGFDTFCPLGPWITVGLDPHDLRVQAWVDGTLRQDGRTSDLIFGIASLVSFVSHVMTLLPGDVISTGTPSGVGPLAAGQVVTVGVEGVGRLSNPVVDRSPRTA